MIGAGLIVKVVKHWHKLGIYEIFYFYSSLISLNKLIINLLLKPTSVYILVSFLVI